MAMIRAWLVAGCTLLSLGGAAGAQAADDLEAKIKAAFLFNFAKFVEWTPDKLAGDAPIEICVLPPDPFGAILDQTVLDKQISGHPLKVRRPAAGDSLRSCHILYVATRNPAALTSLFGTTAGNGTMTIHEAGEAVTGGVARLYLEDNRVRFEINTAAAEREHLQISSKLLSVASVVQR